MTTGQKLTEWAVKLIRSEYPNDVALLINHTALRLDGDVEKTGFSYYVPLTNRSNALARTFIVDGIGYDLFPMSWESLEKMADLKHYNATCLGEITEAQILYAADEGCKQRFLALQARQRANLKNPQYMRERACELLESGAKLFLEMLLNEAPCARRVNAGYLCDLLARAVASANGTYFAHGQTSQLAELRALPRVPRDFAKLYESAILATDFPQQLEACGKLILATREFLAPPQPAEPEQRDYGELAAWYQELSYTWRRVYYWCDRNDSVNAYLWGCMLQEEAGQMGERYGIKDVDFLDAFRPGDLPSYRKQAEKVEQRFVQIIAENGVELQSYASVEAFLENN